MRSVSGDYSLRAAVHHRYAFVLRLPTRLFSATKRTKSCLHVSPTAIENSVQVLSTSGPSATATKSSWVQTVVPVEPDVVSSACAIPNRKDKFQDFVILTVSGRLSSRLSAFFKSVGKCAPPALQHLENNPPPSKQRTLATGPSSAIDESSECLVGFAGEKGCSSHSFSSELSSPRGNDRPPEYSPVMPEPQGPEEDQGMSGGDAVATKVRHQISLDQNPAARTDAYDATPENSKLEPAKGFPTENADDRTTCPTGETGLDPEVAPSSALTLASSSVPNLGPTHEVVVSQVSRQPVMESNFLHFYSTLKPYIVRHELPSRPAQRTPPPIDDGPLPESDGFRVLEGPFTTPAGGTSTSKAEGPPCAPPPLPTNSEVLHEREPEIKHSNTYLAPAIAALTDPTNHQLISQSIVPARLSDEVLGKAMTWDLDILHARTGFSQTLNSTLRSMEIKWRILEFDLALETSDASMFRDNYGFAYKPLALQLPSSPRITELDDENEPVLRKATGEIQSYNGGASGSRQGSGSRARVQQSRSTQLPRGKKRANEDDDDDHKGKKKERREEPPVGDDPSPSGSEDEGIYCPYWVKYRQNCKKKSCKHPKKNLSKLKEHLRRAHFLHLDCPFENCKFHAGDKFQINRHQKAAHAGEIREPIPRTTDSKLLRKNEALKTRNLTWDQIWDICFREEPEEPTVDLDRAADFESEDDDDEEDGLGDGVDNEEDGEDQEDHDDYDARGGRIEYQGVHTSYLGATAAVEENHQNSIPPSPLEANRSMSSNAASTIIDTESLLENGRFPLGLSNFSNFSNFPWPDPLGGLTQDEGHLPSPSPDHDNFLNSGRPPFSSPVNAITWEMVEDHIFRKFEALRGTIFEGLGNRRATSPGAALADVDRFFGEVWPLVMAALDLPNGGGGPVFSWHKESLAYPVPPTGQSMMPSDFSFIPPLLPDHLIGGGGSTLPSLAPDLDSQSSHNSIPDSVPQTFYSNGIPTVASGTQPTDPGMAGSQVGGSAIHNQFGQVLAHRNLKGRWSVGSDPRETQPRFDQTPDWEAESSSEDEEGD